MAKASLQHLLIVFVFLFGITSQSHIESLRRTSSGSSSTNIRQRRVQNGRSTARNIKSKAPEIPIIHMDIASLKPLPQFEVPARKGNGLRTTNVENRGTLRQSPRINVRPRNQNNVINTVARPQVRSNAPPRAVQRQNNPVTNQNSRLNQQNAQSITDQKVTQLLHLLIQDQIQNNQRKNKALVATQPKNRMFQNNVNPGTLPINIRNTALPQNNQINQRIMQTGTGNNNIMRQNGNVNNNAMLQNNNANNKLLLQNNNMNNRMLQGNNGNNNPILQQNNFNNNGGLRPNNVNVNGKLQTNNPNSNRMMLPNNFNNMGMIRPNIVRNSRIIQPNSGFMQSNNNGMLQPNNANSNGMLQPNNVNSNGMLQPNNVNRNGMLQPNNVNSNSMLQPNNVNSNGMLQPSNINNNGLMQPNILQQNNAKNNGPTQPNVGNINIMRQPNNNGMLPPSGINNNGVVPQTNVNNNGVLQPNNVNSNNMLQPNNGIQQFNGLQSNVQNNVMRQPNNGQINAGNMNGNSQPNTNNNMMQPMNQNNMAQQPSNQGRGMILPGIGNIMIRANNPSGQNVIQNKPSTIANQPINAGGNSMTSQSQNGGNINMMTKQFNTNTNPVQQPFGGNNNNMRPSGGQMPNGQNQGTIKSTIQAPERKPNIVTSPNLIGRGNMSPFKEIQNRLSAVNSIKNGAPNGVNGAPVNFKQVQALSPIISMNNNMNGGNNGEPTQIQTPNEMRNNQGNLDIQATTQVQPRPVNNKRVLNSIAQKILSDIKQHRVNKLQGSPGNHLKINKSFLPSHIAIGNGSGILMNQAQPSNQNVPDQNGTAIEKTTIHLQIKRKKVIPSDPVPNNSVKSKLLNAIAAANQLRLQNINGSTLLQSNGTIGLPQVLMANRGRVFKMPSMSSQTFNNNVNFSNAKQLLEATEKANLLLSAVQKSLSNMALRTNPGQLANTKRILAAAANADTILNAIQRPVPKDIAGTQLEMAPTTGANVISGGNTQQQNPISLPNMPSIQFKHTNTKLSSSPVQLVGASKNLVLNAISKLSSDPKRVSLSFNLSNSSGGQKTIKIVNKNSLLTTVAPLVTTVSMDNRSLPFNLTTSKKNGKMSITVMSKHTGGRPIVIEAAGNIILSHVKGPKGNSQFIIKQATSTAPSSTTHAVTEEVELEAEDITTTPATTTTPMSTAGGGKKSKSAPA